MQIYLVFQTITKYFKVTANIDYVLSWKSKVLSAETIKPPATSGNSLTQGVSYYGTKTRVKFVGSCFKQAEISYIHGKAVNICIAFERGGSSSHDNDPTQKIFCLFAAVTLTKNTDIDKYG